MKLRKRSINFDGKLGYILSSLFPERLPPLLLHVFSRLELTCTTTIINLEPRALNAELQHFMLKFHKMSLLC